jgi:hypothetical protein
MLLCIAQLPAADEQVKRQVMNPPGEQQPLIRKQSPDSGQ